MAGAEPEQWDDDYWRTTCRTRPYAEGRSYDELRPAYRYGHESAHRHRKRTWQDTEPELERGWQEYPDRGGSTWAQVKDAVRDAWDRVIDGSSR
jgi:hypothetical protein